MTPHCKFQVRCGNFYILVIPLRHLHHKQHYTTVTMSYVTAQKVMDVFQGKEFTLTIALYHFSERGTFCENLRKLKTAILVDFRCISGTVKKT